MNYGCQDFLGGLAVIFSSNPWHWYCNFSTVGSEFFDAGDCMFLLAFCSNEMYHFMSSMRQGECQLSDPWWRAKPIDLSQPYPTQAEKNSIRGWAQVGFRLVLEFRMWLNLIWPAWKLHSLNENHLFLGRKSLFANNPTNRGPINCLSAGNNVVRWIIHSSKLLLWGCPENVVYFEILDSAKTCSIQCGRQRGNQFHNPQ